jgi:small subunit ribosomal protein S17e
MGKIRNKSVKNAARKIYRMFPDRITPDFGENKVKIQDIAKIYSKKLRNKIAGYLVTLQKQKSRPRLIVKRKREEEKPERRGGSGRGRGRGGRSSRK